MGTSDSNSARNDRLRDKPPQKMVSMARFSWCSIGLLARSGLTDLPHFSRVIILILWQPGPHTEGRVILTAHGSQLARTGGCDLPQLADRVLLLGCGRPMLAGDTGLNGSFDATEVGGVAQYASGYHGPGKGSLIGRLRRVDFARIRPALQHRPLDTSVETDRANSSYGGGLALPRAPVTRRDSGALINSSVVKRRYPPPPGPTVRLQSSRRRPYTTRYTMTNGAVIAVSSIPTSASERLTRYFVRSRGA